MKKGGQVTLYVILGIIVVFIVSLVLYFSLSLSQSLGEREVHQEKVGAVEKENIALFVSECLANVTSNAVNEIYQKGGYADIPPELYTPYSVFNLTCYCCASLCKNAFPPPGTVELQIASVIEGNGEFLSCINDFSLFNVKRGEKIEAGAFHANVTIVGKEIVVRADYPLTITKGDVVENINEFTVLDRRNLGEILEAVRKHMNVYMNGKEFSLGVHAATEKNIKIEGQFFNGDYEIFSYSSLDDPDTKFLFVLYEPLGQREKISSSCCRDGKGKCYEHALCENPEGKSCSEISECDTLNSPVSFEGRGCCKIGSAIQRTTQEECSSFSGMYYPESCTSLGFCQKSDQRVCGIDNAVYQLDSCGNFDEKIRQCIPTKESCEVKEGIADCFGTSCVFMLNDKNGLRQVTLENGEGVCSQQEGIGKQHARIFCENGVVAKEGLGYKRERVCEEVNGTPMRVDNAYELCSSCGYPASYQDLFVFMGGGGDYRCTKEKCFSLGHCTPFSISVDNSSVGNIDCVPQYSPGNSMGCGQCGAGEDRNANLCTKEECGELGNCRAEELATKETLNFFDAANCLAEIALASFSGASVNCPVEVWKLYNLVGYGFSLKENPYPLVHEALCSPAAFQKNQQCEQCMNETLCDPELCSILGENCVFHMKGGRGFCGKEKRDREGKFEIRVVSPAPSMVGWNQESVDLSVETNQETTCRYSWNITSPWDAMVTVQNGDYKKEHQDRIYFYPSVFAKGENKRLFVVACMDKDGKRKTITHSLHMGAKQESEKPLVVANIQGKQLAFSSGKSLQIISDKEVSCKYNSFKVGSANRETIFGSIPLNAFDLCEFVSEKQRTYCEKDVQSLANGTYIFTAQCMDKNGISSDVVPVTFSVEV